MKKFVFAILSLLAAVSLNAQIVEVNGKQSGVWSADTVLVTGNVDVMGALEVQPGTTVLFEDFYSISVENGAEFSALGAAGDSIVFTIADTTGFFNEYSGRGGWNGFQVNHGRVRLDYCVLQFSKAVQGRDKEGGAMKILGGDVEIGHSTLQYNFSCDRGGAIHAEDASLTMHSCSVNENKVYTAEGTYAMYGGGISLLRCFVEMRDMEFLGNYGPTCIGGALSLDSCKVDLHNAVFANNIGLNGGGMYMMRNNNFVNTLYNAAFYNNYSGHFAGGLAFADSSPYVYNLLVTNNASEGVNCNGVFFFGDSQPKMNNCIVYGNYPPPDSFHMDPIQMWAWTNAGYAPEFRNCLIEGGETLITNFEYIQVFEHIIDDDPLFVDALNNDFRLQEDSPCRDAGNEFVPFDLLTGTDLGGSRRVSNGRIDIGPHEYSAAAVPQYETGRSFASLFGVPLGNDSRVVVNLSRVQQVTLRVCSVTGHVVCEQAFEGVAGVQEWKLGGMFSKLARGLYVIEVVADDGVCSIKTVK